jgi:hypothetical protein
LLKIISSLAHENKEANDPGTTDGLSAKALRETSLREIPGSGHLIHSVGSAIAFRLSGQSDYLLARH